jgi:hypothetical protein
VAGVLGEHGHDVEAFGAQQRRCQIAALSRDRRASAGSGYRVDDDADLGR